MSDFAPLCPTCDRPLDANQTHHSDIDGARYDRYECRCGTVVTVTEPAPGLVMTRQDAQVKP